MKLVSYSRKGHASYGVAGSGGIIDIGARMGSGYPTLRALIQEGGMPAARTLAERTSPDFGLDEIKFLPPVPDAEKYICIGVNYGDRNAEYKDGSEKAGYPSVFLRTPDSLVGHGETLRRPPESVQLDYEGEIVIVIGKEGRRIAESDAIGHIAGLTIMNEGTIRDWVRHGKFNVTQGKNFFHSGAMGPWMVTADEIAGYDDLLVETRVNGDLRQRDTTANLLFPFRYLIRYLSTFMLLKPGDVIATGTPSGAGARLDPPVYLKPGDVVEVHVPAVGTLVNPVADEMSVT
jgi:2-keto-4-pentenoate hydratase/2-oxohepta-3-ene-1,7-dioic acid hydratase in catechol pathway